VVIDESLAPTRGVEGFRHHLDVALAVAPSAAVGLGLARGHGADAAIGKAEETQSHWITLPTAAHDTSEAVAILTDVVDDFVSYLRPSGSVEEALTAWAGHRRRQVAHAWPALVARRNPVDQSTRNDSDQQTRKRARSTHRGGSITGQPRRAKAAAR
jgi:hypothetical protein